AMSGAVSRVVRQPGTPGDITYTAATDRGCTRRRSGGPTGRGAGRTGKVLVCQFVSRKGKSEKSLRSPSLPRPINTARSTDVALGNSSENRALVRGNANGSRRRLRLWTKRDRTEGQAEA